MKTEKGITRPAAGALKSGAALLMLALLAACGKQEDRKSVV